MLEKGNRANTLHGILLIALFSFAAFYIAEIPVVRRLSFSPLIVGIVLGMLYANSLRNRLPETWVPASGSVPSRCCAGALSSTGSA
jgi:hypothetical protein